MSYQGCSTSSLHNLVTTCNDYVMYDHDQYSNWQHLHHAKLQCNRMFTCTSVTQFFDWIFRCLQMDHGGFAMFVNNTWQAVFLKACHRLRFCWPQPQVVSSIGVHLGLVVIFWDANVLECMIFLDYCTPKSTSPIGRNIVVGIFI